MGQKIFRYTMVTPGLDTPPLKITAGELDLPRDAEILSVQIRRPTGQLSLWALVDPDNPPVTRKFLVIGTGAEHDFAGLKYISTVQTNDGLFVWHIFEDAP